MFVDTVDTPVILIKSRLLKVWGLLVSIMYWSLILEGIISASVILSVSVIIDSTDPNDISKKLFSKSFYELVYNNLKSSGIFIQQSGSPVLHAKKIIDPTIKKLNKVKFTNITCHKFSMPLYPLGVWSFIKCVKA